MLYETFPGYAGADCGVFFWGVFAMDKPKVMVMLAPGFEEGETVTILDIVRRGGFAADSVRYVADVVVRDGKMIASRAPGTALPFAFALVDALGGDSAPIRKSFLYDEMKAWSDGVKEVSGQGVSAVWAGQDAKKWRIAVRQTVPAGCFHRMVMVGRLRKNGIWCPGSMSPVWRIKEG